MIAFEQARNVVIKLNLSTSILALYDGHYENHELQADFTHPYAILSLDKSKQARYLTERYSPILAYRFNTIFAYDTETQKYVKYTIEYFREENLIPLSWDCLFVDHFLLWWELEYSDEKILEYGTTLGIENSARIVQLINSGHPAAYIIEALSI